MAGAKVVVLYPTPQDRDAFERVYAQDHVPMVTAENFRGITRFVASRVVGALDGSPAPFHRRRTSLSIDTGTARGGSIRRGTTVS